MSAYEGIKIPIDLGTNGLQQTFGSLDAVLEVLNKISENVSDISGKMGGVGDKMAGEFKKAEKGASSLIDKLGKVGLAIEGIKSIAQTVMGSVAPIFEEGLNRDSSIASLKTLLGSKEAAAKYAKELRDEAMSQLYGAGTVSDAAKTMMSFGIDKGKTKEILKSISDIAGGNQQSFQSLTLAFSQATSLGKLQGQDKLQMIGAGFNPLTQISKDLSKSQGREVSVKEVDEMMSKGQITAEMLADAFLNATAEGGTYAGATAEQLEGLNGKIKQFQSSTADLFADLYEAFKPIAESVFVVLNDLLQQAISLVPELATFFEALAVATASVTTAYYSYLGVMKLVWIWQNKQIAMTKLQIAWEKTLEAVRKVGFAGWGAALTLIVSLISEVIDHWEDVKKSFTDGGLLEGILSVGKVLLSAILLPVQKLLEILSYIPGLGHLAGKGASYIKELRENLYSPKKKGIIPGQSGDSEMGGKSDNDPGKASGVPSAMDTGTKAVASGGTRNTSININMGSLVHQITYQGGVEKNEKETTTQLQELLLRVLHAAASTAL